jgi:hypothetical protein
MIVGGIGGALLGDFVFLVPGFPLQGAILGSLSVIETFQMITSNDNSPESGGSKENENDL